MTALHQTAVDGGSWKASWLLVGLNAHMFSRKPYAGTERQQAMLGGYIESQSALLQHAQRFRTNDAPIDLEGGLGGEELDEELASAN